MIRSLSVLDRILKGDLTRQESLRDGNLNLPVGGLIFLNILLGGIYGACMGSFSLMSRWGTKSQADGFLQIAASAAKIPLLFLLTLLVTFPSLYVFNALIGSRLSFVVVSRLMTAALSVILTILASFGTIVVFFSFCDTSYPFIFLLNVLVFMIAGLLGMRFLLQTLHRLSMLDLWNRAPLPAVAESSDVKPTPPMPAASTLMSPRVRRVFLVWILVFGLVGSQMGWILRPFIGSPGVAFTFFRPRQGNVFEAIGQHLADLLPTWGGRSRNKSNDWNREIPKPSGKTPGDKLPSSRGTADEAT